MPKASIRRRLMVSVLATQVILAVAVVSLSTYLTRWQLKGAFDAGLRNRAMSVAAAVRYTEFGKPALKFFPESAPPSLDKGYPDLYRITDESGHILGTSPNWRDDAVGVEPANPHWNVMLANKHYRGIRLVNLPVLDEMEPGVRSTKTLTVIYVASVRELRHRVEIVAMVTFWGSVILLTLATLVAVWAIGKGLSPLAALATSAKEVSAENWRLDPPPLVARTRELAPLVTAMETMLATLHRAFTSQREFLANTAHELKTPVTVLKSTLQSILQRPRAVNEYQAAVDCALEDIARLEKLIHSMLRLARAEQAAMDSAKYNCSAVDLNASCEQAIERLQPLAEANDITVEMAASNGDAVVNADPDDLDLIWSNLLENAIRYSDRGQRVFVRVTAEAENIVVAVQDWGTGIPADSLPHIFDRFHRADTSRTRATGGYGLGLAIASAMAESYRGSIAVQSEIGEGTILSVRLPKISFGHAVPEGIQEG